MKLLGIVTSPRRYGNTEILVKEALKSAKEAGLEVELYTIKGKKIAGCNGCETCRKTGICQIKDDMQELTQKMIEADGFIIGTPVYFWGPTSQAKVIIDRSESLVHPPRLKNKIGGIIAVATRGGCNSTFTAVMPFFSIQRMLYVGGAIAYGHKKGDVKNDERGMAEAKALGRVMARHIYYRSGQSVPAAVEAPTKMPPKGFSRQS